MEGEEEGPQLQIWTKVWLNFDLIPSYFVISLAKKASTLNVIPFLGTGEDTPNIPAFAGRRWTSEHFSNGVRLEISPPST